MTQQNRAHQSTHERGAWHEAGHVVMAFYLKQKVTRANTRETCYPDEAPLWVFAQVTVAGAVAQYISSLKTGDAEPVGAIRQIFESADCYDDNFKLIRRLVAEYPVDEDGNPTAAYQCLNRAIETAHSKLSSPSGRRDLAMIADALLAASPQDVIGKALQRLIGL